MCNARGIIPIIDKLNVGNDSNKMELKLASESVVY